MIAILYILLGFTSLCLMASVFYLIYLTIVYFVVRERETYDTSLLNRFALLVPAYNEELLISQLCESLLKIDYSHKYFDVFIIADNCTDRTAEIAGAFPVRVLVRNDPERTGKGYAIDWALDRLEFERYDAVLIVDADNIVDSGILKELNRFIASGEEAIQCYNSIANRSDSWLSELLFVSRTVNNLFYHHAKYKLGLSSYLTGNGICFTTGLLKTLGWKAFSIGEDWEYYAKLINNRIKVAFAKDAKVFHQESTSISQATTQRFRWSSGRFSVLKNSGIGLFLSGIRNKDWFTVDASFPLVFPNYSLQVNMTMIGLFISLMIFSSASIFTYLFLTLLLCQFVLFLAGAFISGSPLRALRALLFAPVFLVWKGVIDFLSFTGLYRTDKWIRTRRHKPDSDPKL